MQLGSWKKFAVFASLTLAVGSAHAFETPAPKPKDKSLSRVHAELYGKDRLKPSKNSLIGKYLQETGAKTVVRTFPNSPAGNVNPPHRQGAKKLVVSVSEETFENFKQKFSGQEYLYVYFYPNQSTLQIAFNGQMGNAIYRSMTPLAYLDPETLIIPILLDSDEGRQVAKFMKAAANPATNPYMFAPWGLQTQNKSTYSASSSFQGCTHWFGNIPIGKKKVESYFFPAGDEDPTGAKPNTKKLEAYVTPAGMNPENEATLRDVWTVPGRQQLGEVLAPASNRRGEFTNPGWVAYTLLGTVGIDRVPVVYYLSRDAKAEIPANFPLHIQQY